MRSPAIKGEKFNHDICKKGFAYGLTDNNRNNDVTSK